MQLSLVPVTTTPKDFKAITDKLKANAASAKQTYSDFAITDEISMSSSQRAAYSEVMTSIDVVRHNASLWKKVDNTSAFSTYDRNPEKNQISAVSDGSIVEGSYDDQGVVTLFSHSPGPNRKGNTTLFQENNEALIFSLTDKKGTIGILFDKTSHQGTIFKAV